MTDPVVTLGPMTVEEYLAFEETSEVRHEYVGGMLHAMAGGSDRHSRISLSVAAELRVAARGTPCRVYNPDMRVLIGAVYYYPDVMVACEEPETENPVSRSNPCLIVEVLSPSSLSTDRREKLQAYQGIPTLRTYLIVHQDTRRVEHHFRGPDGAWRRGDFVNDGEIAVPCPETVLTLAAIYEDL